MTLDPRIRADLDAVLAAARVDPAIEAVLLTGGFSRGEGSIRAGRPVNDYDLVAVRSRPGRGPAAAAMGALGRRLGVHVDWLEVWRARLPFVGPKLFWFDLGHGGVVLAGDAGVLSRVPVFRAEDLPAEEALRLLANRAAGLVLARGRAPDVVDVQAAKALLAVMEARLVLAGLYAPTLRERLARFRALAGRDAHAAEALPWVERAAAFKLAPDRAPLPHREAWDAGRALVLAGLPAAAAASPWRTLDGWLSRGTAAERVWYALRAKGAGLPRATSAPTARARRVVLELLREPGELPAGVRRDLAAFALRPKDWDEAREVALRVRDCTLQ